MVPLNELFEEFKFWLVIFVELFYFLKAFFCEESFSSSNEIFY